MKTANKSRKGSAAEVMPKNLDEVIELLNQTDGELTPKAFVARVKYATEFVEKDGKFGPYADQQVTFESSNGTTVRGYNKNEAFDFTELVGQLVVVAVPAFETRKPQIVFTQNGQYTNLNLAAKVEVWYAEDETIATEDEDYENREWRFTFQSGGEAKPAKPTNITPKASASSAVNFNAKTVLTPEQVAEVYGKFLGLSINLWADAGVETDGSAIQATAATLFIDWKSQRGADVADLLTPVEAENVEPADDEEDEEEEVEEEQPKRRTRRSKKVVEPEEEDDEEDDEEEDDEEEEPAPSRKRRTASAPAKAVPTKAVSRKASGSASKRTSTTATKKSVTSKKRR